MVIYFVENRNKNLFFISVQKGEGKMKIIIMTGAFGGGHVSAATAVSEQLHDRLPNAQIQIVDVISQLFEKQSKLIYGMFHFLVNHVSFAYNTYCKVTTGNQIEITAFQKMIAKRINAFLDATQPDAVVVTIPLLARYISCYKERHGGTPALYTYITDIEVRPEWLAASTDQYFVASDEVKQSLIDKGVFREDITVSGIPVRSSFVYKNGTPLRVRNYNKREVLIMGGGMGMIPGWKKMIKHLLKFPRIHITVIAGNNQALQGEIQRSFPTVRVIGVTNQVAWYMYQADVLVSKSGGVTMFEAIYSETPMCVIAPFLSQEQDNAKFIENHQMGVVMWKKKEDYAKCIRELLNSPYTLLQMRKNMRSFRYRLDDGCPYEAEWRSAQAL